MARGELSDRQFELLLERLEHIGAELSRLNRRLERDEGLARIERELAGLSESLQALAYAALGHGGPQVRRRRSA